MDIPRIPLGDWIEGGLTWLTSEYSLVTRGISRFTQTGIDVLNDGLMWLPRVGAAWLDRPALLESGGHSPSHRRCCGLGTDLEPGALEPDD